MQLRIVRTFKWVQIPGKEIFYGGPPPDLHLVPKDVLQWRQPPCEMHSDPPWEDVPVVEMERPPHPHEEMNRRARSGLNYSNIKSTGAG